ncbi:MAG: ASKHA domain-containing protein, partial [Anaerolineales bacterium]
MIPDCELSKVVAVGNAAGDGARIALLNRDARQEAARLAHWVEHVQTAVAPNFQAEFVGAMALPHATDPFPHLEGIIPARPANGSTGRRSQRRRATQTSM